MRGIVGLGVYLGGRGSVWRVIRVRGGPERTGSDCVQGS